MAKITFCTSGKNCAEKLQKTYIKNLLTGKDFGCDFVLVDQSADGNISEWIKDNLSGHIDSGLLFYDRVSMEYSYGGIMNFAHRLGKQELLCNLPPEAELNSDFIDWVMTQYSVNDNVIIKNIANSKMVLVKRSDFTAVNGYNTGLTNPKESRDDFINRILSLGRKVLEYKLIINT